VVVVETALDGYRDGNRGGERWRTSADGRRALCVLVERGRTTANADEQRDAGLETTWASELTVFFSPLLSQTYLRRTGGICALESGVLRPSRLEAVEDVLRA